MKMYPLPSIQGHAFGFPHCRISKIRQTQEKKLQLHPKSIVKMIKAFAIRSQFHIPKLPNYKSTNTPPKSTHLIPNSHPIQHRATLIPAKPKTLTTQIDFQKDISNSNPINANGDFSSQSKALITGAVSIGVVLLVLGLDGDGHGGRALALGPEGPLMEEFWENVRRYALYALTVSTGVLYAVFQPIVELLKNPISAILVIVIVVGGVYIGSQVLSAMVGVTEFSYEYSY